MWLFFNIFLYSHFFSEKLRCSTLYNTHIYRNVQLNCVYRSSYTHAKLKDFYLNLHSCHVESVHAGGTAFKAKIPAAEIVAMERRARRAFAISHMYMYKKSPKLFYHFYCNGILRMCSRASICGAFQFETCCIFICGIKFEKESFHTYTREYVADANLQRVASGGVHYIT